MKNIKKGYIAVFIGLVLVSLLVAACSSSKSTTTTVTSSSTTQVATFQNFAADGQTVYANNCKGCHGDNGQGGAGPALWGSGPTLGTYKGNTLFNNNAQDMLTFISSKMPLSAPGSLTHQQYLTVLAYILVQDSQVPASNTFAENQLNTVTLK